MKSFMQFKCGPAAVGTLLILTAGCGRDNVKVYHVNSQDSAATPPPPVAAPAAMPATMPNGLPVPDNSGLPSLKYTQPASWEKKAPTQMRVASFGVSRDGKQADVSVIPLAGMAGTDLANVNRWRGQVGLASLPDADLAELAEKVTVGDQPADLYDLVGTAPGGDSPERILAVILHREDTSWFFKMSGDAALVEAEKSAFVGFLKSVTFGPPGAAQAAGDVGELPSSHPPISGMSMGGTAMSTSDAGATPAWTVPTGWQAAPLEQFLVAKYVITGAGTAQAAVNVSSLAGDGGGLLANINRWRGQLGLMPVTEADIASLPVLDVAGGRATLMDISGTDGRTGKATRLVGVVLPLGGQTWFYKLMGDADIVAQQKDALVQFVQSAKYPDAH